MDETISIVLFSGTDDKLQSAAVPRRRARRPWASPVKILLQYWALDAFRADRIDADHGLAPEAGDAGRAAVAAARPAGRPTGRTRCAPAKELGEVDIQACSLSMDILKLKPSDLDSLVDGVEGVASFYINAGEGQILFI